MSSFPFSVKGLDELLVKLDKMPADIRKAVDIELKDGSEAIAGEAKLNAPVDVGFLRLGIGAEKDGDLSYQVFSNSEISAYVEWGTGSRVSIAVDPEIRAYEETFKTGKETVGMYAQPFFFPALAHQEPIIIERVKAALNEVV